MKRASELGRALRVVRALVAGSTLSVAAAAAGGCAVAVNPDASATPDTGGADVASVDGGPVLLGCERPGPYGAPCAAPVECGGPSCGEWRCVASPPGAPTPYQWQQLLCGGPQQPPELVG